MAETVSFQFSCVFHFNTDSQVVENIESILTCVGSFHLFVSVREDLEEIFVSVFYIDTVQCQVKKEP